MDALTDADGLFDADGDTDGDDENVTISVWPIEIFAKLSIDTTSVKINSPIGCRPAGCINRISRSRYRSNDSPTRTAYV